MDSELVVAVAVEDPVAAAVSREVVLVDVAVHEADLSAAVVAAVAEAVASLVVVVEVVSAAVEEEVIKHDRTVPNSARRMKAFIPSFAILAQASYHRYLGFQGVWCLKGMLIQLANLGSLRMQSRRAMMSSYACTLKIQA